MAFAAFWEHILQNISGFQNINLKVHFVINHMLMELQGGLTLSQQVRTHVNF
jgi:hypothetical protein